MTKTILVGFIIGLVIAFIVNLFGCTEGIVTLEGYKHGVGFCEKDFSAVILTEDAYTWNDGVATYVVNKGHYNDPEVMDLVDLAHKHCK